MNIAQFCSVPPTSYRDLPAIADDPHPLRALLRVAPAVYRHVAVIVVRQPTVCATIAEIRIPVS
jgi:hypothetical protein